MTAIETVALHLAAEFAVALGELATAAYQADADLLIGWTVERRVWTISLDRVIPGGIFVQQIDEQDENLAVACEKTTARITSGDWA